MKEKIADIIMAWWDEVNDRKFAEVAEIIVNVFKARLKQEIEGAVNDYSEDWDYTQWMSWENCRHKILTLLKELE